MTTRNSSPSTVYACFVPISRCEFHGTVFLHFIYHFTRLQAAVALSALSTAAARAPASIHKSVHKTHVRQGSSLARFSSYNCVPSQPLVGLPRSASIGQTGDGARVMNQCCSQQSSSCTIVCRARENELDFYFGFSLIVTCATN